MGIRLKNKLDSLFFNPGFVPKRHKSFDRRAESEIRFAFLGANASEWGLVLKLKIFTYLFEQ